jgi:hypothetical protein
MELDDLCITTPLLERMPLLETAIVRLGYSWPFRCKLRPTRYGCGVCAGCIEFYFMELGSFSSARHLELRAPNVKVHKPSQASFFLLLDLYPIYRQQYSHSLDWKIFVPIYLNSEPNMSTKPPVSLTTPELRHSQQHHITECKSP